MYLRNFVLLLVILLQLSELCEGRKRPKRPKPKPNKPRPKPKPKPSKPRPKPKPQPQIQWETLSGTTYIGGENGQPAFLCTYKVAYTNGGDKVNPKETKMTCKKTDATPAPTGPTPPPERCEINPSTEDNPEHPPFIVDKFANLVLANGTTSNRLITVDKGETITLYCPDRTFDNYDQELKLYAKCISGTSFEIIKPSDGSVETVEYKTLGCNSQYREDFIKTGEACGGQGEGELVKIGFQTEQVFYQMMEVCHDKDRANNLYVHHTVLAAIGARDTNNQRPSFSKDGFYRGYDIDGMMSQNGQTETITTLVGSSTLAETYVPRGTVYLARGHLAPNADYMLYAWQDATFTFIDTSPQWQIFNAGNWLVIEDGVRDLAEAKGDIQVWTGTHEVLELPDVNGNNVEIYLDEDGEKKLPVPRYFWKVVYHAPTKKGLAVVGANNPHFVEPQICADVGDVSWLTHLDTVNVPAEGVVWSCDVQVFADVVPNFPGGIDTSGGLLV